MWRLPFVCSGGFSFAHIRIHSSQTWDSAPRKGEALGDPPQTGCFTWAGLVLVCLLLSLTFDPPNSPAEVDRVIICHQRRYCA